MGPTVDPTKQKTPQPTQDQNGWGNPKPSKEPKTPRPSMVRTPRPIKEKTARPTKGEKTARPTVWRTERPAKTPRPIKEKTPRPAKPVKTPRPSMTRTPRPTPNKEKTSRPTQKRETRPPKKTERPTSTYLRETTTYLRAEPKPSHAQSEMIAVEMNGSYAQTMTGYSAQTEIIGLLSVATVLALCGYSLCKQRKEEKYVAIADVSV